MASSFFPSMQRKNGKNHLERFCLGGRKAPYILSRSAQTRLWPSPALSVLTLILCLPHCSLGQLHDGQVGSAPSDSQSSGLGIASNSVFVLDSEGITIEGPSTMTGAAKSISMHSATSATRVDSLITLYLGR